METSTTCTRHGTPTRLACSQCGTPICPRCSVDTPVGQKCPDCARLPRSARAQAKPRQYVKGVGAGVVLGVVAAFALSRFFTSSIAYFLWIVSGFVGFGIGRAMVAAAEGNRAAPLQRAAIAVAVGALLGAWLIVGAPLFANLSIIGTYPAAAYGAYLAFTR